MPLYELDGHRVTTPAAGRFYVAPNATVIGRVTLAEDVSIWFNAVIRGDNEPINIGARTSIQEGTVLHVDPGYPMDIGEDVTVGHMVMLHGCTIGKGSLIGIGAIVLNGARIGEGSLIGAGSLVAPGDRIPPGMLALGSPAKVRRPLNAEERERVRKAADQYMEYALQHARELGLLAR